MQAAKKIKAPLLLLQAGADSVVHNAAQDRFCQQKRDLCDGNAPRVVADAYHEIFFEEDKYRDEGFAAMLDMFERHL